MWAPWRMDYIRGAKSGGCIFCIARDGSDARDLLVVHRGAGAIDPGIFKAYDVRGLYGEQIDADVAYRVARAFIRVLAEGAGRPGTELHVAVGHDMRLTSPELSARYIEGIRDEGADVFDVGAVATEMLYFTVGSRELDGGLMCTASHNPKPYTGAKLVKRGAIALSGDRGIQDLRRTIEAGMPERPQGGGSVEELDVGEAFRERALSFISPV